MNGKKIDRIPTAVITMATNNIIDVNTILYIYKLVAWSCIKVLSLRKYDISQYFLHSIFCEEGLFSADGRQVGR